MVISNKTIYGFLMNSVKLFTKKIKGLRLRDNLSQEDLAELMDVHANTIGQLETERPSVKFENIDKLAKVFRVLPSYFFNPVDLTLKSSDKEKKELITKKLEELSPKNLDIIYKLVFTLDDDN